ncbi:MAG: dockerin type I domain-containing protein [Candidatus Poribacteria bacterium]|nr:dockerin type I domain-containing protein [Candidatus Poribacteria bacterium]
MKKTLFTIFFTQLFVFNLYLSTSFAQDYTQWALPEGAKARLGKGNMNGIAYSPDGKQLAVASSIGVWIYDAQTGKELDLLTGQKAWVMGVEFSPDGQILASHGNGDNNIYLWDVNTRTRLHTLAHVKTWNAINSIVFSPIGQMLASCGSSDNTINLWNPKAGTLIRSIHHNASGEPSARALAFSPNGQILISQSIDKIIFWDIATYNPIRTLTVPDERINWIALSPDGQTLAGATEKRIYLWHTDTGAIKHTMEAPLEYSWITFSPNGQFLLQREDFSLIHIWNVNTGTYVTSIFAGLGGRVLGVNEPTLKLHGVTAWAFTPDEQTLAFASGWGNIELWDANTFSLLKPQYIYGHTETVHSVAFSPDGKIIASGHADSYIRFWDAATGEFKSILTGHKRNVRSVTFINLTEPILVSAGIDGEVVFWDYNTLLGSSGTSVLRVIETGDMHTQLISRIAVSQDGKRLASASHDKTVSLWNAETGEYLHTLAEGNRLVESVAFSPDGQTLASSSDAVYLWNTNTGTLLHSLKRGDFFFGGDSIAFSPDGKIIAGTFENDWGEWDRAIDGWPPPVDDGFYLWDVDTGKLLRTTRIRGTKSLAFSPDGKTIVSGDSNGSIHLWDMNTGTELHTYREAHKGGEVTGLAFSPEGHILASSGWDGTVLLWNVDAGTLEPERLPEDVNADGVVNIQDLVLVAQSFGDEYNPDADVNNDGVINILDLVQIANAIQE